MSPEAPHVLAISGSERAGGNTEQALTYVAGMLQRRDFQFSAIHLREQNISPCGRCGDCNFREQPCEADDDMPSIIRRMVDADAIIYAAPVHGFGLAHLMQTFIERAGVGYLRFQRPLANKVGGALVVSRRYSDTQVHQQLVLNMLLNRMIVVGSGFPALLRAGRGGVADDTEGMDALDRMVQRLADMVLLLRSSERSSGQLPLPCDDTNERQPRAGLPAVGRAWAVAP
ncbi:MULTISPECIES: flavodoxin family protein [unclassified Streptomyces]|uniref:flavodoxin family protein n=1 Tax=unclassified Streptomyces TaxID=2593676 RepID=UPI0003AA591A|nr:MULTISPECIES: flavodoxin family protein [unclassified Streptomyces]MYT33077.1 NADPH-dependent FMN reductase [Streptomyces sp. SID8354]